MVILGIDPGSITTGYAFLDVDGTDFRVLQYGVVHAGASDALENRLLKIVTELETLIDKFHPQALAMEGVFFAKNAKSALVLGHIRGAILVACRRRGMTFDEYPPRLVKQAVTGDGAASKEQVANMVFARLGIEPGDLPLDASDACTCNRAYACHAFAHRGCARRQAFGHAQKEEGLGTAMESPD